MLGSNELMNSRLSGSEQALARLSCQRLQGRRAARLLIGGLGMGFTLRAALAELAADASITVAELVPAVVAWARGPMAEIFGDSLDDQRVTIRQADVAVLIRQAASRYDAILLDVDNGPEGLSRQENDSSLRCDRTAGGARSTARRRRAGGLVVGTRRRFHAPPSRSRLCAGRSQGSGQRDARRAPHHLDRHRQANLAREQAGIAPIQDAVVVPVGQGFGPSRKSGRARDRDPSQGF